MPDVFLTGGTGFIGGALLGRLLAAGRSVRALGRSSSALERLGRSGVEVVFGEITDEAGLVAAMSGCGTVFHVAGLNTMCLYDPLALDRVNIGGTRAVVRAAARSGVDRVVYTSSAAAIGEASGVIATESTSHRGSYITAYERSKHLAEIAAFEEAATAGVDLVAVNPSSVQGPGRLGGTARILIAYLQGRLRFAIATRMSLVFVGDVVEAHLIAERRGIPGERYLVNGWTTTVSNAIDHFSRATGETHRVRYLPVWAVRPPAALVGGWHRLLRRDAPLCSEMVRVLEHGHAYDGSRIESEWGFRYTAPGEWLRRTIEWYRDQGLF